MARQAEMKLNCPYCGARLNLVELVQHKAAAEALVAAFQMSNTMFRPLMRYLSLFCQPGRDLPPDKLARLLNALLPWMREHRVRVKRVEWPATDEMWIYGMEDVIQRVSKGDLTAPLESHNYLYKVIATRSDKAAKEAEDASERERRYRALNSTDGPASVGAVVQQLVENQPTKEGRERGLAALRKAAKDIGSSSDE